MRIFGRYVICFLILCFGVSGLPCFASQGENAAADAVATAFSNARQAAHLPKLMRMEGNRFHKQACTHDMRFPSGFIEQVAYETSTPSQLPEAAERLAAKPDSGKTAARFGVGVCVTGTNSQGQPVYSIVIATYESRGTSFWRIFWD